MVVLIFGYLLSYRRRTRDGGAAEAMLARGEKPRIINGHARLKQQDQLDMQNFLKSINSSSTLPEYVRGDSYSSKRGVFNQCLACGAVLILAAAAGQPIGFSAVALPQMSNETGPMRTDATMGSWIASIHSAATPLGSMLSGSIMEAIGRRRALQSTVLPLLIGWVLISTANTHIQLLAGRVVCGLGVGVMAAPSQVYLGEIAEPKLRGLLIGTPFVAYSLGIFYVYTLGGVFSWRTVALMSMALPSVAFLVLFFCPESPTWLARRGRFSEASAALSKLRGDETLARRELHDIISAREKEKARGEEKVPFFATISKLPVLKPLLLVNLFNTLQILSGTYIVIFYAVDILKETGGSVIHPNNAANISAFIRLIFSSISCYLLLKWNRRTLALVSGVGTSMFCIALAIVLFFNVKAPYLGAVLVLLAIGFNSLGFMVIPGTMIGELLPAKVRGLCGGYIFGWFNMVMFGFTKVFPMISESWSMGGVFGLFGAAAILATLLLYLMLPETKGKTLIEIEEYYQKSNLLWITRHRTSESGNV